METWNNGATEPTNTQLLEGVIEPNDVFVIMNALAAPGSTRRRTSKAV